MSVCSSVKFILVEKTVLYSQPEFCPPPAECRFPMVIKKTGKIQNFIAFHLRSFLLFLLLCLRCRSDPPLPSDSDPDEYRLLLLLGLDFFLPLLLLRRRRSESFRRRSYPSDDSAPE